MSLLNVTYQIIEKIFPFDCMQMLFMQRAMLALLLIAPASATMGLHVINFRMAFFTDAIAHSAFTGVAIGLLLSLSPYISMPVFALLTGIIIVIVQRKSNLSIDTVIGIFFSGVIAFGLTIVSRDKNIARNIQQFLYGDILTITETEIFAIFALTILISIFQLVSFNKLLYIGFNQTLAEAHRVNVALFQYFFAALLALLVIFSVWIVGVLLVTALLIVPAAAARNLSSSAGHSFWWAIIISEVSAISGLLISAQDWANTATGATIVLIMFLFFVFSLFFRNI